MISDTPFRLTDGVVALRPLTLQDAERHLAGEDEEQVRWLNYGRRSTPETVRRHIERLRQAWKEGSALWGFGVVEVASGNLVGYVEGNGLGTLVGIGPDEANISYAIFLAWRRQGFAVRAVDLLCAFLAERSIKRAVIRVHPENEPSADVARRAGFRADGWLENIHGPMLRFVRDLAPVEAPSDG